MLANANTIFVVAKILKNVRTDKKSILIIEKLKQNK